MGDKGGLLKLALPAAVAGFLALSVSAIFADQVAINSSSNATLPILWQVSLKNNTIKQNGKSLKKHSASQGIQSTGVKLFIGSKVLVCVLF